MKRALAACLVLLAACSPESGLTSDELTIVVQGDRHDVEQQEKALREREEAFRSEKTLLDARIGELAKGLKAAADAEQRRRIEEELRRQRELQGQLDVRGTALEAQKTEVQAKKQAIDSTLDRAGESVLRAREAASAAREAKIAEREGRLASREHELAAREQDLGGREKLVALREKSGEPAPRPEQKLSARDVPKAAAVEARHKKLLAEIEARGLLISDLPTDEQPLNAEIFAARRRGDLVRAMDLVADLTKAIARLQVDQRFVEQKMLRLQGARAATTLAPEQRGEVERLLRDVTASYSDGKYEQANKGLNRIAGLLDAGRVAG